MYSDLGTSVPPEGSFKTQRRLSHLKAVIRDRVLIGFRWISSLSLRHVWLLSPLNTDTSLREPVGHRGVTVQSNMTGGRVGLVKDIPTAVIGP